MEHVLVRVLGARSAEVAGRRDGDRLFVSEADLDAVTGWHLEERGACRGDRCAPIRDRASVVVDGWVDVAALAALVGLPLAVEPDVGLVAVGHPAAERAEALSSLAAPDVRLPTVGGGEASVHDLHGRKRLLVTFASWCGCRYDLPAWQRIHQQWGDLGFSVVAVAVDESADDVRPWVDEAGATFPVLVDADHELVDAYAIRNVPTVVWIDEDDRIVRPNAAEFGDDQFVDFHGQPSGPHLDALERWVVDGEAPNSGDDEVRAGQLLPDADQQQARAEYRLAIELLRDGAVEAAERHFEEAGRLAPHDFTIRRGSMPLRGLDPFGEPFFELYEEWEAAGRPYYTEPEGSGADAG